MKRRTSSQIRSEFLHYFEENGHCICPSYPLVPPNDPTLLFTNAGMVQFKDVFTGKEKKTFNRAASSQKCVRVGGKHNDLENVGHTARHHTFFEMLGNFSFGDYFKKQAICFSWNFLVERMGLDPDRLWVSVFKGDPQNGLPSDEEAAEIWETEVGFPSTRIVRFGKQHNFWSMGETGPCGPCCEIHYDQGEQVACNRADKCLGVGCECDRYLEVWNLVFMQFNRDKNGDLTLLPTPSIDTGLGLERLAAIMQGVLSNYETDLFFPLIHLMSSIAGCKYGCNADHDISLRIIADHARATAFLMSDGVLPSNEGRGYVLRRIMRRAICHGAKLGVSKPFLHEICSKVIEQMGAIYPDLPQQRELIEKACIYEEETFQRTLHHGMRLLENEIKSCSKKKEKTLHGKVVFELQTRDGFPPDLTETIALERGFSIDHTGYQTEWKHHQQISGQGLGLKQVEDIYKQILGQYGPTEFSGYQNTQTKGRVQAILDNSVPSRHLCKSANTGQTVEVIISPTPFYGETGGQVGDTGYITSSAKDFRASVADTQRVLPELIVHKLHIDQGEVRVGEVVSLFVDAHRRQNICQNHSATHLLHAALRKVLGAHVNQKGSLVCPERLRFDFSHFAPLNQKEIYKVEQVVNSMIQANLLVETIECEIEQARDQGATMLFGEKYGERVRMVRMGDVSCELCGGSHVARTGDIGLFHITGQKSVQVGVRRIEAVTGSYAVYEMQQSNELVCKISAFLHASPSLLLNKIKEKAEHEHKLSKQLDTLKTQLATACIGSELQAREVKGVKVLATCARNIQLKGLRNFADHLQSKLGNSVVLVTGVEQNKISGVCTMSKSLSKKLNAQSLLKGVFEITGGHSGGRADFAQGGGGDVAKHGQAFDVFYSLVEKELQSSL